jgi:DNA repair protein SbcD/Mre11
VTSLKFLHASDLHLGRQFSGLLGIFPELREIFRRAGYDAWATLVQKAVEERVDFVVLAGDVFHDTNPPIGARVAFKRGLESLSENSIPVFLALGNHDPLRSFPGSLRTLPGLHVFPSDPQTLPCKGVEFDRGVVVCGASFERSAVTDNLVRRFTADPGVDVAIGVVHTNVSGSVGHQDYAPCTLDDLLAAGMHVWCLGHVHSPRVLWQDPLILYAGTSQGAHALETGPKGCWLVTLPERGSAVSQFVPLAAVLWDMTQVPATNLSGPEDLLPLAEEACSLLISENPGLKALALGIALTGERPPWQTGSLGEDLEVREMLSERLAGLAVPVCLQALSDRTRSAVDLDALVEQDGFLGDLLRLCREAAQDPQAIHAIKQDMRKELVRKVSAGTLDPLLLSLLDGTQDPTSPDLFLRTAELIASTFLGLSGRKE